MSVNPSVVLGASRICKSFGEVRALTDVSLQIGTNEVVGLVGDNGAGKSTFVQVVAGVFQPDEGDLWLDGREVVFSGPADARARGIETVFQDLGLAPDLDVALNVFMGRELLKYRALGPLAVLDRKTMQRRSEEFLTTLGLNISSGQLVSALSAGQRQSVAIARACYWGSRLLRLDEPTAALGAKPTALVNGLIRTIAKNGTSILLVSHNFAQVLSVADRVVVLRHGRFVASEPTADLNGERLLGLVTGAIA